MLFLFDVDFGSLVPKADSCLCFRPFANTFWNSSGASHTIIRTCQLQPWILRASQRGLCFTAFPAKMLCCSNHTAWNSAWIENMNSLAICYKWVCSTARSALRWTLGQPRRRGIEHIRKGREMQQHKLLTWTCKTALGLSGLRQSSQGFE